MAAIDKEYAAALFALAREEHTEQETADALNRIQEALSQAPDYTELLASPSLSGRERAALLTQAFEGAVPEQVLSFACLLCERGHIRQFGDCVREYARLLRAYQELSVAHVTSAVPLSEEQKTALIRRLEALSGHTVTAQYAHDDSLMGGVIVRMDGSVWDGSLRRRLRDIKEVMDG